LDSLCLEFLNSEWGDFRGRFRRDQLQQPAWVGAFLQRWQLDLAEPLAPQDLQALVDLRASLRQIFVTLPAGEPPSAALQAVNAILLSTPPLRHLVWDADQGYTLQEVPASRDGRRVMTEIAASFADLLVHREVRRLKVCENPYCRGYFYDETRSGTQRWCLAICANLWKARRFRARLRAGP
jgi:predicted RNA-binding Zn ribbon-like protein